MENQNNLENQDVQKWHYRDVAEQIADLQRAMSSSLLKLVQSLEGDICNYGCASAVDECIPDDAETLSEEEQESTYSFPTVIRNKCIASRSVTELSKLPGLCDCPSKDTVYTESTWTAEGTINLHNVINSEHLEMNNTNMNNNILTKDDNINENSTSLSNSRRNDQLLKGSRGWFKNKFHNPFTEATKNPSLHNKKGLIQQQGFVTFLNGRSCFTEKYNNMGDNLYNTSATPSVLESALPKLCVFDSNHMPLTDLYGNVLKDVYGQPLVLFDNKGRPLDRQGSPVFDSRGFSSLTQGFSPCENHRMTKLSPIDLFDSKGYPLTGKDGHVLLDPNGETIVKFCHLGNEGLVIADRNDGGIWDIKSIPLCPVKGRWQDQDGKPYRFFNKNCMPITDSCGRELYNIDGESLLVRDNFGRPFDVQDTFDVNISSYAFDGTLHPPSEVETFCRVNSKPIKLFNSKGHPLTDEDSRVLYDSYGNPLVKVDFHNNPLKDEEGINIFDERKFPLFCNPTKPIRNMDGKTMLFYDKFKKPLTDRNGIPLISASGILLIKFDYVGRPCADQRGKPLCDMYGREISDPSFEATCCPIFNTTQLQISYSGKSGIIVYDRTGRPLTDADGNALVNSDGTSLEFKIIKQKKKILKQQFDNYGRPLYDKYNRSLYCHGKPIFNIFGDKLIDMIVEDDPVGCVRLGEFNKFGIPLKDKYLRNLYDKNGNPYCDKTGTPESEKVRTFSGILLLVKDEEKIVKLPIERAKMLEAACPEIDKSLVGIPEEFSVAAEEWVIADVVTEDIILPQETGFLYLLATVRTTNLSRPGVLHEILSINLNK